MKKHIYNTLIKVAFGLFCLVCSFILIFSIWFGLDLINGNSMVPNFTNNERIIFERYPKKIVAGDVVLVKINDKQASLNNKKSEDIIKRVVGVPGDAVRISHGKVFVNDVQERFNKYKVRKYVSDVNMDEFILDDDEYFVLGDNRPISFDSHYFGPIKRNQIWGKFLTHFMK